jgi:endonuclease/exonuclease/phosphatase family metal-dependent hydrolase
MTRAKKGIGFFGNLFLFVNVILAFALLVSTFAHTIPPEKIWFVAFFGLAYPFLLLGNVIFFVYWLLRRKLWFLLSGVCIATGWDVLQNSVGLRSPSIAQTDSTNTVRAMTYNVHNFKRYGAANDIPTKHEILALIAGQKPDVIGFQEFYTRSHGQYDMVDSLKAIMQSDQYYFEPFIFNGNEGIGMAIFSRYLITGHGMLQLSDEKGSENQCIWVDIKKDNKIFRFYSVHLQSIRFDPEDYKYLNEVSNQGETDMSATKRLGLKLKNAFIRRSMQVAKVKQHAAACTTPYIISGDFNDTPASYAVSQMSQGLVNAFREKGSGLGRTYNGDFPNYQIDYIMASKPFAVTEYRIIGKKLSDHYPVFAGLLLKP